MELNSNWKTRQRAHREQGETLLLVSYPPYPLVLCYQAELCVSSLTSFALMARSARSVHPSLPTLANSGSLWVPSRVSDVIVHQLYFERNNAGA